MPGMGLGGWQVLSAPSISEPLGFNGHYCPSEDLNSSWLWSCSLIHLAYLSLQGRPSSFHKPWSQRHFLWNQERISSDQIPSYLAFRLKKHSFIFWFIYSLDKYTVDVNHVFGPALGLQWWARQGPAIKKLPALGRGIWFQGRLEGWGCHSQNQCSLCSQNPSHIPMAQATLLGALSTPLMLPPEYPMNSYCWPASKCSLTISTSHSPPSSLVRWNERKGSGSQDPGLTRPPFWWRPEFLGEC